MSSHQDGSLGSTDVRQLRKRLDELELDNRTLAQKVDQLGQSKLRVYDLEQTAQELQMKIISLQQDKARLQDQVSRTSRGRHDVLFPDSSECNITNSNFITPKTNLFLDNVESGANNDLSDIRDDKILEHQLEEIQQLKILLDEKQMKVDFEIEDKELLEQRLIKLDVDLDLLQHRAHKAEMNDRQLRDKLKLAEYTINELEASEGAIRENLEALMGKEKRLVKEAKDARSTLNHLRSIMEDRDVVEQALREKIDQLEALVATLNIRVQELEQNESALKQQVLQNELQLDAQDIESIKLKCSTLDEINIDLNNKVTQLEENEETLRNNWRQVAEEDANRMECLQQKSMMLQVLNKRLKTKLEEEHSDCVPASLSGSRTSIGSDFVSAGHPRRRAGLSAEQLEETIQLLEDQLQLSTEEKNTKIEALQERIDVLQENEITLSESLSELEINERQILSKLALFETSEVSVEKLLNYEDRIKELTSSQENLLDHMDSLEDREDNLKQGIKQMEAEYKRKLTYLESEARGYRKSMKLFKKKIDELESLEKELKATIKKTEEDILKPLRMDNQTLKENMSLLEYNEKDALNQVEKIKGENSSLNEIILSKEKQSDENRRMKAKINVLTESERRYMERIEYLEEREQTLLENQSQPSSKPIKRVDQSTETVKTPKPSATGKNVSGLFERVTELESSNTELNDRINILSGSEILAKQLQTKVLILEQAEDRLMERVMELEENEDRLRKRLSQSDTDNDIEDSRGSLQKLHNLEKERDILIDELEETKASCEEKLKTLSIKMSSIDNEFLATKEELVHVKESNISLKEKLTLTRNNVSLLKEEKQDINEQLIRAEQEKTTMIENINKIEMTKSALLEKLSNTESELATTAEEMCDLKTLQLEWEKELEGSKLEKEKEIEFLNESQETLFLRTEQLKNKIVYLENQLVETTECSDDSEIVEEVVTSVVATKNAAAVVSDNLTQISIGAMNSPENHSGSILDGSVNNGTETNHSLCNKNSDEFHGHESGTESTENITILQDEINVYRNQISDLEDTNVKYIEDKESMNSELKQLHIKYDACQAELIEMQRTNINVVDAQKKDAIASSQARKDLISYKESVLNLEHLNRDHRVKVVEFTVSIDNLNDELVSQEEKNHQLQVNNNVLKETNGKLSKTIVSLQEIVHIGALNVSDLENLSSNQVVAIDEITQDKNRVESELASCNQKLIELADDNEKYQESEEKLKKSVAIFQDEINVYKQKLSDYEQLDKENQVDGVKAADIVSALQSELDSYKEKLIDLDSKYNQYKVELTNTMTQLENKVTLYEEKLTVLEERDKIHAHETDNISESLRKQINDYQNKIKVIETTNTENIVFIKNLETNEKSMSSELNSYAIKVSEMENHERVQLEGKMESDLTINNLIEELDLSNKEITEFKALDKKQKESSVESSKEITNLQNELDACLEKLQQLEQRNMELQQAIDSVAFIITEEETLETFHKRVETFRRRPRPKSSELEAFQKRLEDMLKSNADLRDKLKETESRVESLSQSLLETKKLLTSEREGSTFKQEKLKSRIRELEASRDKPSQDVYALLPRSPNARSPSSKTQSPTSSLERQKPVVSRKTVFLSRPTKLGRSDLQKSESDADDSMLDSPKEILQHRIQELERLEAHLRKQLKEIEADREELHQITRKDKTLIHQQNVQIRELQMSDKLLKDQLNDYESSERLLNLQIEDLQDKITAEEHDSNQLRTRSKQLEDLLKKEQVSKTDLEHLSTSEKQLKDQVNKLQEDKQSSLEKCQYLKKRLQEVETSESKLLETVQSLQDSHEDLKEQLSQVQNQKSESIYAIHDLQDESAALQAKLQRAVEENSKLVYANEEFEMHVTELDKKVMMLKDVEFNLTQHVSTLSKSESILQDQVKVHQLNEVRLQMCTRELEKEVVLLQDRIQRNQHNENVLKHRIHELEASLRQDPSLLNRDHLPGSLPDCHHLIWSLDSQKQQLVKLLQEAEKRQPTAGQKTDQLPETQNFQPGTATQKRMSFKPKDTSTFESERIAPQNRDVYQQTKENGFPRGDNSEYSTVDEEPVMQETSVRGAQVTVDDEVLHLESQQTRDAYGRPLDTASPQKRQRLLEDLVDSLSVDTPSGDSLYSEDGREIVREPVTAQRREDAHSAPRRGHPEHTMSSTQGTSNRGAPGQGRRLLPYEEEEITVGLELSSETDSESQIRAQNDTDSTRSERGMRNPTYFSEAELAAPPLPSTLPPAMPRGKGRQPHFDKDATNSAHPSSRRGRTEPGQIVPKLDQGTRSSPRGHSVDSGWGTGSTGLLQRNPADMNHDRRLTDQSDSTAPSLKTEPPSVRRRRRIQRLEKEIDLKDKQICMLHDLLQTAHRLLREKPRHWDQDTVKRLAHSIEQALVQLENQEPISSLQTSHAQIIDKKDQELIAKRNEVEKLVQDLRQSHDECQALELMRNNAVASVRNLELKVLQLQTASSELHTLQEQHRELQGEYKKLERKYAAVQSAEKRKNDLEAEVAHLKSKVKDASSLENNCRALDGRLRQAEAELTQKQEEEQRLRKEYSVLEDKMEQASSKEKQHKNTQLELQNMRARVDELLSLKAEPEARTVKTEEKMVAAEARTVKTEVKMVAAEAPPVSSRRPVTSPAKRSSSVSSTSDHEYLSDVDLKPVHITSLQMTPNSLSPSPQRQQHRLSVSSVSDQSDSEQKPVQFSSLQHRPKSVDVTSQRRQQPVSPSRPFSPLVLMNGDQQAQTYVAVANYTPQPSMQGARSRYPELPLKEGQAVSVTGPVDSQGFYEAKVDGRVGLIPARYLKQDPKQGEIRQGFVGRRIQQLQAPASQDQSPEQIIGMHHVVQFERQRRLPATPVSQPGAKSPSPRRTQPGPEPPSNVHAENAPGDKNVQVLWMPPVLDHHGDSNGCRVVGYRILVNGRIRKQPNHPQLSRAVLEHILPGRQHRIAIQTVASNGMMSPLVETVYQSTANLRHDSGSDVDTVQDLSTILSSGNYQPQKKRSFLAIYDYDPSAQSPGDYTKYELPLKAGDKINVYGEERPDGFYHGEVNGQRGLVPAFFAEEVPSRFKPVVSTARGINDRSQANPQFHLGKKISTAQTRLHRT